MTKTKETLEPGYYVMVYTDPTTRRGEEGEAFLVEKLSDRPDGLEYWRVRFVGEKGRLGKETFERAVSYEDVTGMVIL